MGPFCAGGVCMDYPGGGPPIPTPAPPLSAHPGANCGPDCQAKVSQVPGLDCSCSCGTCQPGGTPNGNYCLCLGPDEPVTLTDGTEKLASEVEVGDRLMTIVDGIEAEEVVTELVSGEQNRVKVSLPGTSILCSSSHHFMSPCGDELIAGWLSEGDLLLSAQGSTVEVTGVSGVGRGTVYGWTCEPTHTFLSRGVLHHNKSFPSPPIASNAL